MLVSVCIPAYRGEATLHRAVAAALDQDIDATYEVIVCVSADEETDLAAYGPLPNDPRLTVVTHVPRLSASEARQRCIEVARGELLAFTDADALPHRDWLRCLVGAGERGTRIVGGSVVNGTPHSRAGTAEYLVEFADLAPGRPARTAWHGALCNLLMPRPMWHSYGPFPVLSGGGEDTVITATAHERGDFVFCGEARVTHLNRTRLRVVLAHQYQLGRFSAHIARAGPHRARSLLVRPGLAPVAAAGRVVAVYVRAVAWLPGQRVRAFALFPVIVVMLGAWGSGLFVQGRRLDRAAARGVSRSGASRPSRRRRPRAWRSGSSS